MSPSTRIAVQNHAETKGSAGDTVWNTPAGPPVELRVNVRPVNSGESTDLGLQMTDVRVVIYRGRTWPGNAHSVITWKGTAWDPVGPAVHYTGTSDPFWQLTIRRQDGGNGAGL